MLPTQQIHISSYHLQSNCQEEQFNGTIMLILQKLLQEKQISDEHITVALFAYQEVPHRSIGLPPGTLLFWKAFHRDP